MRINDNEKCRTYSSKLSFYGENWLFMHIENIENPVKIQNKVMLHIKLNIKMF